MYPTPRNKYMETSIQTASPAQLLVMLYDGAIRFCRQAIEAMKEGNHPEAHRSLIRAQNIISEFNITLDREVEISASLASLYDYFHQKLVQANMNKTIEPVEEVIGFLAELRETWVQAALLVKNGDAQRSVGVNHG